MRQATEDSRRRSSCRRIAVQGPRAPQCAHLVPHGPLWALFARGLLRQLWRNEQAHRGKPPTFTRNRPARNLGTGGLMLRRVLGMARNSRTTNPMLAATRGAGAAKWLSTPWATLVQTKELYRG